jgi:DNA-binding transcriptional regulator GbsR (MarR family)
MEDPELETGPTSDPLNDRLTRRVLRVGEAVGRFIEYWGFKTIHGRVWVLLALHKEPLAQTEIAQILGVSRSLISGSVADLVTHGLLRPVGDHRNAPYEAMIDFWPTIADILRGREWMLLESARVALEGAVQEAERAYEQGRPLRYDVDRMRVLLAFTELGQALLRVLISLRTPRGVERLGGWFRNASSIVRRVRRFV